METKTYLIFFLVMIISILYLFINSFNPKIETKIEIQNQILITLDLPKDSVCYESVLEQAYYEDTGEKIDTCGLINNTINCYNVNNKTKIRYNVNCLKRPLGNYYENNET